MGVNSGNKGYIGTNQTDYLSGTLNSRQSYLEEDYKFQEYSNYSYVRPSEWAQLPGMTAGTQMIAFVYGVYNSFSNHLGFYVNTTSGNFNVDWGDGTTGSYANNALATKQYTPTTYAGLTTAEFRNYKTLVVKITAATGNLQQFNLRDGMYNYPLTNIPVNRYPMVLDIRIAGSTINYLNLVNSGFLEQFEFIGTNLMTYPTYMLSQCFNLEKVVELDLSKATATMGLFSECYKLKEIPFLNTSQATNFYNMFGSCRSLINIPLLDTSKATTLAQMFYDCRSLITVPQLNTANCTDFTNMFNSCFSLKKVPLLNTSKATTFEQMFFITPALQYIPVFDSSNVTNFYRMFYGSGLKYFPKLNMSKATTVQQMFWGCNSLEKVEDLNTSSCTNFSDMFYGSNIQDAPNLDTSSATSFSGMFGGTIKLRSVPNYNTSKVTTFKYMFLASGIRGFTWSINTAGATGVTYATDAFYGMFDRSAVGYIDNINVSGITSGSAYNNVFNFFFGGTVYPSNNLVYVGITGIMHNFEVRNANLGPTAINSLFTSLAVVGASGAGAKTINVFGNWGASAGLGMRTSIAIEKGWTVTI